MKNGFLVIIFSKTIRLLAKFNLVEYFKWVFVKISTSKSEKNRIKVSNIAIDVFIVTKYLFLIIIWIFHINKIITTTIIIYLIIMNLFTYFYYHTWKVDDEISVEKYHRRLISLMTASLFSVLGYAYLYAVPFKYMLSWSTHNVGFDAFIFSLANSFFVDYINVKATSPFSIGLSYSQLVSTFVFVTVILSTSLAQNIDD